LQRGLRLYLTKGEFAELLNEVTVKHEFVERNVDKEFPYTPKHDFYIESLELFADGRCLDSGFALFDSCETSFDLFVDPEKFGALQNYPEVLMISYIKKY
jgi:predicted glycosyltransferase involved in capsule biosynthesis